VPNAALRFKPELSESEQEGLRQQMEARREQRAQQGNAQQGQRRNRSESQAGERPEGERSQRQTVWVLTPDKKIEPRFVRAGLTNGRVTEVAGGSLQEGETVVIGKTEANASTSQPASSPFAPQGGRGMGRRGR
jgi:HlyD family secretion protein